MKLSVSRDAFLARLGVAARGVSTRSSIQTLSGALVRPDSNKEQRLETYCLLAKDHITLGNSEEAEAFVRALLALQASYELPERESPRFRDFFATVRAKWIDEGRPGAEQTSSRPVTLRHRSPTEAPRESGMVGPP